MIVTEPTTARLAPDWLLERELGLCPCGCIGRRRKGGFVAKTMHGLSNLVRRAIFSEDAAATPGLLQRLDARVKVVSLLAFVVVAAFVHTMPVLAAMYLLTVALAVACRLSVAFFVRRVWLFVPIFTGLVVLPATVNLITPGHIVVPLGTWFGHHIGATREGLEAAGLIVLRVGVSISLVVLLTLTTRWNHLLAALRSLRVPAIVILVLGMAYRYIFHLLGSVTEMYTARRARTVRTDTDVGSGRRFVAGSAGALFGKTHALAEEVHMAMVARGYDGNARTLARPHLRYQDGVWCATCALATFLVLWIDHVVA